MRFHVGYDIALAEHVRPLQMSERLAQATFSIEVPGGGHLGFKCFPQFRLHDSMSFQFDR
jgi:hypothetical protein